MMMMDDEIIRGHFLVSLRRCFMCCVNVSLLLDSLAR